MRAMHDEFTEPILMSTKMTPFLATTMGGIMRGQRTFESSFPIHGVEDDELVRWINATEVHTISAVEWKRREDCGVGPRAVEDCLWLSIVHGSGSGWMGRSSDVFRYRAGDMILIPAGTEHFVAQDADSNPHLISIQFTASLYGAVCLLSIVKPTPTIRFPEVGNHIDFAHLMAHEFAMKAPGWQKVVDVYLMAALYRLLRTNGANMEVRFAGDAPADIPRLLPLFETMDRHIADPGFKISDMARLVHLNEVQFRRLFRRLTGLNPIAFFQKRRIDHARMLLRTTPDSVESIATACGFIEPPFFYRVFRKWTSMTPGQYRSSWRV
jgi:AraC-like DNA-binding protein/mannose-6-phosphate isomerase-like protein (cupin superfamily)